MRQNDGRYAVGKAPTAQSRMSAFGSNFSVNSASSGKPSEWSKSHPTLQRMETTNGAVQRSTIMLRELTI